MLRWVLFKDEGELLDRIATCVSQCRERRKAYRELCIQHCGGKCGEQYGRLPHVQKGLREGRKDRA